MNPTGAPRPFKPLPEPKTAIFKPKSRLRGLSVGNRFEVDNFAYCCIVFFALHSASCCIALLRFALHCVVSSALHYVACLTLTCFALLYFALRYSFVVSQISLLCFAWLRFAYLLPSLSLARFWANALNSMLGACLLFIFITKQRNTKETHKKNYQLRTDSPPEGPETWILA